jgi:hypothetical protein
LRISTRLSSHTQLWVGMRLCGKPTYCFLRPPLSSRVPCAIALAGARTTTILAPHSGRIPFECNRLGSMPYLLMLFLLSAYVAKRKGSRAGQAREPRRREGRWKHPLHDPQDAHPRNKAPLNSAARPTTIDSHEEDSPRTAEVELYNNAAILPRQNWPAHARTA